MPGNSASRSETSRYRAAYHFVAFGLLLATAYRGLVRHEAAWDLLALVVLSGGIAEVPYQRDSGVRSGSRWALLGVLLAAAVVAALLAISLR